MDASIIATPILVGERASVSKAGVVAFTDLAVVLPLNSNDFTDLRLRFAGKIGSAGEDRILFVDSHPFAVWLWSSQIVKNSPQDLTSAVGQYTAGDILPPIQILIEDCHGESCALVDKSNIDVHVLLDPAMNVLDSSRYVFCESIGAICTVRIFNGVAEFKNLKVTWVDPHVKLLFQTAVIPGTPQPFSFVTEPFAVNPARFTQLEFESVLQQGFAGAILPPVRVKTVDEFGNLDFLATGYRIILGLDSCTTASACTFGDEITASGIATFVGLHVFSAGDHTLQARVVSVGSDILDFESCAGDIHLKDLDIKNLITVMYNAISRW